MREPNNSSSQRRQRPNPQDRPYNRPRQGNHTATGPSNAVAQPPPQQDIATLTGMLQTLMRQLPPASLQSPQLVSTTCAPVQQPPTLPRTGVNTLPQLPPPLLGQVQQVYPGFQQWGRQPQMQPREQCIITVLTQTIITICIILYIKLIIFHTLT